MQIIFTDKCKKNIIYSEGGIKLNLNGYAFYNADLSNTDIEKLTLDDIKTDKIICKNTITDIYDLPNNLFDFTFIPALDSSVIKNKEKDTELNTVVAKFGQYEIDINKGLTEKSFSSILIIGEEFNEDQIFVYPKKKYYLAAVITDEENFSVENPQKIIFKVSLTDFKKEEINESLRVIDTDFNEFTKNEFMKDLNTIQLPDNYTLTPDKKHNDYDSEINIVKFDSEIGNNNVISHPTNLVLLDKSNKMNNNWNMRSRVTVGVDNGDKQCNEPHLELSYGVKDSTDEFISNSVVFQYDNNHIGINQCTGINKLQVDIFPEDIEVENKRCIKKRIKRFNIFDYSLVSANQAFFKYDSHNSKYTSGANNTFEFINRNNTLGTSYFPVKNVSLIRSSDNFLSGYNSNSLLLNSNYNNLGYSFIDSTLINSVGTNFVNNGVYYNQGSTVPQYRSRYYNNVFIGTENIGADIKPNRIFANNITFIGKNTSSNYAVTTSDYSILTDCLYTVPCNVSSTEEIKRVDLGFGYRATTGTSNNLNIGNETLIGFNGLSVDRLPNYQVFYKRSDYLGTDENKKSYYYYSNTYEQSDTTFAVKMGNYNANYNPNALQAFVYTDLSSYMNDGDEYSNTVSSYYSVDPDNPSAFTIGTGMYDEHLYQLYFKNSHDTIYTENNSFGSISADEGDFSIEKLWVVGNGNDLLGKNITGLSPAQMASNKYEEGKYCHKIDLFSVEKDSYQLVHNTENINNSPIDCAYVQHFPGIFAVRGTVPVTNKYFQYRQGKSPSTTSKKTFNKFNLQNAIYTTNGIYIPRKITSNDVYPLTFDTLNDFSQNGGDKSTLLSPVEKYSALITNSKKVTSFVYECSGIVKNKQRSYDVYVKDIISDLNKRFEKLGIVIPFTENKAGVSQQIYTFYLINTANHNLRFNGELRGNVIYPKSKVVKILNPGDCIEIIYSDKFWINGKSVGGVLNFEYK